MHKLYPPLQSVAGMLLLFSCHLSNTCTRLYRSTQLNSESVKLALYQSTPVDCRPPWPYVAMLIQFLSDYIPSSRVVSVTAPDTGPDPTLVEAEILKV